MCFKRHLILPDEEKYLLLEAGGGEGLFFAGLKHVAIKVVASYTEDQIITSDPSQLLAIKEGKRKTCRARQTIAGRQKVMTWGRAAPVLVLCVIFDALRAFFSMFWFLGLHWRLYIARVKVRRRDWRNRRGTLLWHRRRCGGHYGFVPAAIFGTVMAMAIGLLGWLHYRSHAPHHQCAHI